MTNLAYVHKLSQSKAVPWAFSNLAHSSSWKRLHNSSSQLRPAQNQLEPVNTINYIHFANQNNYKGTGNTEQHILCSWYKWMQHTWQTRSWQVNTHDTVQMILQKLFAMCFPGKMLVKKNSLFTISTQSWLMYVLIGEGVRKTAVLHQCFWGASSSKVTFGEVLSIQ